MTRVLPLLLLTLSACATARPEIAIILVTFDDVGSITRIDSDDLAAGDPRREACALFVGEIRTSMRGSSAGAGSVRFGCPLASFAAPEEGRAR